MSAPSVSGKLPRPTGTAYKSRVAQVIRDVRHREGLTAVAFAERISSSPDSVSNWENELTIMDPVKLLDVEHEFPGSIEPVLDLARSHDLGTDEHEDLMPLLAALLMTIATARSPQSPGGIAETHGELLAMENLLLDARRGINRRLARIRQIRGC